MLLSKRSEPDYAVYRTVVSAPEVEVQLRVPTEDTALDIVPNPVDIPKCVCIVATGGLRTGIARIEQSCVEVNAQPAYSRFSARRPDRSHGNCCSNQKLLQV